MSGEKAAKHPKLSVGELVYDTAEKALGVVMDTGEDAGDGCYALRPPGGGVEWTAKREDVRPATVVDQLRPALTEVNARSSKGELA
ncbi:hypothetical protein [Streptomyces sp. NPDC005953]|uniref:hypothetical protein n=1 Tax=unclassified Streptomyces TaxID=2593676 RepID=UPI0033CA8C67